MAAAPAGDLYPEVDLFPSVSDGEQGRSEDDGGGEAKGGEKPGNSGSPEASPLAAIALTIEPIVRG